MRRGAFDRANLAGVRVVAERRAGEALALAVALEVGTNDELPQEEGAAHLLEHVAFKGDAATSGDALAEAMDALGGNVNAFTSHEQTCYHGVCERERVSELAQILATLVAPAFREDDVAAERRVVGEEIAMAEDDVPGRAFEWAAARFYRGHPHGRPVLGTAAGVAALDGVALARFRDRTHHRAVATIFAVGAYDFPALLEALAPIAAALPAGPTPPSRPRRRGGFAAGSISLAVPHLRVAHHGLLAPAPSARSRDRIAAELLALVLGAPDHGRFHWALIEPGLADGADAWFEPARDHGVFGAHVTGSPSRRKRVASVIAETLAAFEEGGPTEGEWRSAQRALALAVTLEGETVEGRALAWVADRGRLSAVADEVDRVLATPRAAGLALLAERPFQRSLRFEWWPERVVGSGPRWRR